MSVNTLLSHWLGHEPPELKYRLESRLKGFDRAPQVRLKVEGPGDDEHGDRLSLTGDAVKNVAGDDDALEKSGVYSLKSLARAVRIKAKAKADVKVGDEGLRLKATTDVKVDVDAMKVLAAITGRDRRELDGLINSLEVNITVRTESVVTMVQEAPAIDVERAAGQLGRIAGVMPELGDRYLGLLGPLARENPGHAATFMDGMDRVFARQGLSEGVAPYPGGPLGPFSPYNVELSAETNAAVSVFVEELDDGTLNARIDVSVSAFAGVTVYAAGMDGPVPPPAVAAPPDPRGIPEAAFPAVEPSLPEPAVPTAQPVQAPAPAASPSPTPGTEKAGRPRATSPQDAEPFTGLRSLALANLSLWQQRFRLTRIPSQPGPRWDRLQQLLEPLRTKTHIRSGQKATLLIPEPTAPTGPSGIADGSVGVPVTETPAPASLT